VAAAYCLDRLEHGLGVRVRMLGYFLGGMLKLLAYFFTKLSSKFNFNLFDATVDSPRQEAAEYRWSSAI